MKLTKLTPMLRVSNIEASLDFYQEALGFEVVSPKEAVKEWRWATIRSGDTELMLAETEREVGLKKGIDPHANLSWTSIYYFYPDDVAALHTHIVQKGLSPTSLQVTVYGMREFSLQDPDGHMLSFGQDADE